MKRHLLCFIIVLSGARVFATPVNNDSIPVNQNDVSSIDAILDALYDVISGPASEKRNWERMRTLFLPEAKLIATGNRPDGSVARRVMTVEDYISSAGPNLEQNGFFEKEIGRRTERFNNVAQVFSTYASRRNANDEKPFMRGINSIQLLHTGERWWIVNILWENESPEKPIPPQYLHQTGQ